MKSSGCSFPQSLTNQGPTFDNKRPKKKPMRKHSGNKRKEPNWVK
jgi:hypothetical protein